MFEDAVSTPVGVGVPGIMPELSHLLLRQNGLRFFLFFFFLGSAVHLLAWNLSSRIKWGKKFFFTLC